MTAEGARLRIDEIDLRVVRRAGPIALEVRAPGVCTAASPVTLPVFEGWIAAAELSIGLRGQASLGEAAGLEVGLAGSSGALGESVRVAPAADSSFEADLVVPLKLLRASLGAPLELSLSLSPVGVAAARARTLPLLTVELVLVAGVGPSVRHVELSDVTDAALYGAAERRSFELSNPEEGVWRGTGEVALRVDAEWSEPVSPAYAVDTRPERFAHALLTHGDGRDPVREERERRTGLPSSTRVELWLDTSHPGLEPIPEEGRDVALSPSAQHVVTYGARKASLTWRAAASVRVRDPRPHLKTFQRLSAVGIDFGTSATVAALYQRGFRSLLQLGKPQPGADALRAAENPTALLVEDHERLWAEMAKATGDKRFPSLVRALRGSHAALALRGEAPTALIGELKTLPERILSLEQAPQLRDRLRQRDFLLDEARVRALIRAYAYLLSRAINRPGQDVFLRYVLTRPAKLEERTQRLVEEELRAGLLLGVPEGIPASEVQVEWVASEPEAFAAEVCPELCAHPDAAALVERLGELRFVVFDLGGGSLDIAAGRFRPATEAEQAQHGSSTVIETLQVTGATDLGGELLTHELAWRTHQHPTVLPEMEANDLPILRPATVPAYHLAAKPELTKRSLAARQNEVRLEQALGLERVKFGPEQAPSAAPGLRLVRLDGAEVETHSLGQDLSALSGDLRQHLVARLGEGAQLLASALASTLFPGEEPGAGARSLDERGILVLLAGNSSRSAFVSRVLAEKLGVAKAGEAFAPWRPEDGGSLRTLVEWETKPRSERGTTIVGVTPKTAVALGALKLASHEVHLVRASQGFGWFLGDLRGFPPKFVALVAMGAPSGPADQPGPHLFDFGRWDTKMPLRVTREYVAGKMTSSDPRLSLVPTGFPPGFTGRLCVAVTSPDEVTLCLDRGDQGEPLFSSVHLGKALR
jgi:hypothetical protein